MLAFDKVHKKKNTTQDPTLPQREQEFYAVLSFFQKGSII